MNAALHLCRCSLGHRNETHSDKGTSNTNATLSNEGKCYQNGHRILWPKKKA